MPQTLSALPSNTPTQGHGLPTLESNNACHDSGFSTVIDTCLTAATAEIRDASHFKPLKDAENDWRCQHGGLVSTDGRSENQMSL
uniref:Uncharacterized protein n=1 Tax=Romanomermis culicivorax TaxID=13658 RepID=A0A915KSX4_ROMCU